MKTLYVRIVATYILIAMVSGVFALLVANVYYRTQIREYNEQKIMKVAKEIRTLFERIPDTDPDGYFRSIAQLGFQMYLVDGKGQGVFYGEPFRHTQSAPDQIRRVLDGEIYRGITEEPRLLTITGFFESSLRNTVGIPVDIWGERHALFLRPALEQQIGEVRLLMAVLLAATFAFSMLLIVVCTRYIVKPVKALTEATTRIVGGNYEIGLDVARADEIGNLARHFAHMAEALRQLDSMRQEFVANVSHEIQSPLTSIQGFAQAIQSGELPPEIAQRYLHIIEEESRRLSSLSKQLLTLAALDKETGVIKKTSFRLDEQLRQAVLVTEWQWMEKGITVELDLPEIVVHADRELLHQVWLNLITNAIKFSDSGDVLTIGVVVEENIIVRVSDTGMGIPESELPHIFGRFYKADKARTRSRSGSGLGLAIVKKIVELHEGTIDVHSRVSEGTVFTVRLPRI